jgi:hypothetical protein
MKNFQNILTCLLIALAPASVAQKISWQTLELINKGRIDALAHLGNGVIIAGTRDTKPAYCFRSTDYGATWKKVAELESTEKRVGVTCLETGNNGICYLLNESSEFFRSMDSGDTWEKITKLSTGSNDQSFALSYGICVTQKGTILVSDSNTGGGSVFRSTDKGLTFSRTGIITTKGLYRFTLLENSIIVNGWEGVVFVSKDDGLTWERLAVADQTPLYATESLGGEEFIQGTESGNVFVGNISGRSLKLTGKPGGAADDFVYAGYGVVIFSTYTGSRSTFVSYDKGNTWTDNGIVPTRQPADWLDHVIRVESRDSVFIIGGTNKGYILRTSLSRDYLKKKQSENSRGK